MPPVIDLLVSPRGRRRLHAAGMTAEEARKIPGQGSAGRAAAGAGRLLRGTRRRNARGGGPGAPGAPARVPRPVAGAAARTADAVRAAGPRLQLDLRRLEGIHGHQRPRRRRRTASRLSLGRVQASRAVPAALSRREHRQQPRRARRDWVRACKGGAPACSNFSIASKYTEWLVLGAAAVHQEGKLMWDNAKGEFKNAPEANKYVKPTYRKGWEVKV